MRASLHRMFEILSCIKGNGATCPLEKHTKIGNFFENLNTAFVKLYLMKNIVYVENVCISLINTHLTHVIE